MLKLDEPADQLSTICRHSKSCKTESGVNALVVSSRALKVWRIHRLQMKMAPPRHSGGMSSLSPQNEHNLCSSIVGDDHRDRPL